MKKILFAAAVALITIFLFCWVAFAAEVIEVVADVAQGAGAIAEIAEDAKAGTLPGEPFDWSTIATIAGATAATLLIVQLLKLPLDKVWKIPTRIWVYIIALALMLAATAFTTGLDMQTALLTAVNAVIVALAAMGSYELTFGRKKAPPDK